MKPLTRYFQDKEKSQPGPQPMPIFPIERGNRSQTYTEQNSALKTPILQH